MVEYRGKIAKVVAKTNLSASKGDYKYWLSLPTAERIAAVEQIRSEHHGWDDESKPRLQRVFRIIERS